MPALETNVKPTCSIRHTCQELFYSYPPASVMFGAGSQVKPVASVKNTTASTLPLDHWHVVFFQKTVRVSTSRRRSTSHLRWDKISGRLSSTDPDCRIYIFSTKYHVTTKLRTATNIRMYSDGCTLQCEALTAHPRSNSRDRTSCPHKAGEKDEFCSGTLATQ